MDVDWNFYLTFPEDTILPTNFFAESNENSVLEGVTTPPKSPESFINGSEDIPIEPIGNVIIPSPPKSPESTFNEPEEIPIEPIEPTEDAITPSSIPDSFDNTYQYNLSVGDSFDNWVSVDMFIHNYCLERGFGYQIFRNDKDSNNRSITLCKSYRCSYNGSYKARKNIDQDLYRLRDSNKSNCEWHCNFSLQKEENKMKCITLVDTHNHE